MKTFCALIIFIALSVAGLGVFVICSALQDWSRPYFSAAKIVLGGVLALIGATLSVATVTVIVSDKVKKRRMRNKGGKK